MTTQTLRRVQPPASGSTEPKYQAFVSYSHSDAQLAASLQSSLSQVAKPWYRLRTLRVFRDETSLSANPALWHSIEQALSESAYLLLLASPSAAESPWVQKELEWWLQNRSAEKILIALTDGAIVWDGDAQDFDWGKTTALPPCLKHAFRAEPLYADFRPVRAARKFARSNAAYRSALLDVAAPLLGRSKDDLDSEDARLHRRTQRIAWIVAVLTVALGATAGHYMYSSEQRGRIATSQALASTASQVEDPSLALLLSLESRRTADTVEARRSLLAGLQRLPHTEAFLWGHSDAVTKAVFTPDGQTILSAGWDDRIILWNASTHQQIGQPLSSPKGLVGLAINHDGSRFATTAGGSVTIWDTSSRQPVGEPFVDAQEDFVHVGFSPNGKLLAATTAAYGGHPAHVFVWDVATHQEIGQSIEGSVFAFSPDNTRLAIGQYEDLRLYDLRSHRIAKRPLTGHTKNIVSAAFNQDGALVATAAEDESIVLWDVHSQRQLSTFEGAGLVNALFFDPSGRILLSGSSGGTIMRWDLALMKAIDSPVQKLEASISSIFLGPDGVLRSLATKENRVVIIDVNDDPPLGHRIRAAGSGFSNVAFSPDGRFLASSGEFGEVLEWDVASGDLHGEPLSDHSRRVQSLAYTPDGTMLVSGSQGGSVIFWDMNNRTVLGAPMRALSSPVWSLACSPDGKIAVAAGDAELVYWNLATRTQLGPPITAQKDRIWAIAFSKDGEYLASAGNQRTVMIWKTAQPTQPIKTLGPTNVNHYPWVIRAGVAFHPDGKLLAMGTRENTVSILNFKTGEAIEPVLEGHMQPVTSVDFSPDGKMLASASEQGDIRLWDVETHKLIGVLAAQQKGISAVAFNPQRGLLASVDKTDSIVFWEVDFDSWSRRACRIADRNLTPAEWSTYIANRPYSKTCPAL